MIKTKEDYRYYLQQDKIAYNVKKGSFFSKLLFSESYYINDYVETLRKLEFLTNSRKNVLQRMQYYFTLYKYRKYVYKTKVSIPANVVGPGLCLRHLGLVRVHPNSRIGKNCTLQPGVVIGQKGSKENVPVIGDNVYFGPGAKVFGKVRIGNNVTIASNAVVVKDVPDDCTVVGVYPTYIVQRKGQKVKEVL